MKIQHNGLLLRIYLSESEVKNRAVIEALASAGIAGATVFRGIEGYGTSRYVSFADVVHAYVDLPILIEVVEEESKVRDFVPQLESVLGEAPVTLERVQTNLLAAWAGLIFGRNHASCRGDPGPRANMET